MSHQSKMVLYLVSHLLTHANPTIFLVGCHATGINYLFNFFSTALRSLNVLRNVICLTWVIVYHLHQNYSHEGLINFLITNQQGTNFNAGRKALAALSRIP